MTREVDGDIEAGHMTVILIHSTLPVEEHAEIGEEFGCDSIMASLQLDKPLGKLLPQGSHRTTPLDRHIRRLLRPYSCDKESSDDALATGDARGSHQLEAVTEGKAKNRRDRVLFIEGYHIVGRAERTSLIR